MDHENKVGIENQINTDSGASLGASIKSVFGLGSTASEPVSTASINTTASSSGATSTAGVVSPLDARSERVTDLLRARFLRVLMQSGLLARNLTAKGITPTQNHIIVHGRGRLLKSVASRNNE